VTLLLLPPPLINPHPVDRRASVYTGCIILCSYCDNDMVDGRICRTGSIHSMDATATVPAIRTKALHVYVVDPSMLSADSYVGLQEKKTLVCTIDPTQASINRKPQYTFVASG